MISKLLVVGTLILSVASQQESASCSTNQRKEIRELTPDEFKLYVDAVKSLQKRQVDGLTVWESFTKKHVDAADARKAIHGTTAFLPWHRWFIKQYELELQKFNPKVTLPYWDWTIDAREPHKSIVLSDKLMGGNGKLFSLMAVTDGAFKNTNFKYPRSGKLSRSYDRGTRISQFATSNELVTLTNSDKLSKFCQDFEILHGEIHSHIGGSYDFGKMTSPNDPLFFLHHAFIDLIWAKHQAKFPNLKYEGDAYSLKLDPKDKLHGYDKTVESVLNIQSPDLCYTYPTYPRNIKVNSDGDSSNTEVGGDSLFDIFKNLSFKQVDENLSDFQPMDTKSGRSFSFFGRSDRLLPSKGLSEEWMQMNGINSTHAKNLLESRNRLRAFVDSLTIFQI